jgi:hypothetical protein
MMPIAAAFAGAKKTLPLIFKCNLQTLPLRLKIIPYIF